MARLLLTILLIAACGAASAAPFVSKKRCGGAAASRALRVRGGAGPVDATALVKAVSVLSGAQGAVLQFAPEETGVAYGMSEEGMKKPANKLLASYSGTSLLTQWITMGYLAFAKDATARGAYLMNIHVWIYENFRVILGGAMEDAGAANSNGVKLANLINVLGLCLIMAKEEYTGAILKVLSVFWGLNGVRMIVDPQGAADQWGFPNLDDLGKAWMQTFGHGLLAQNLVLASMLFLDYGGIKAVGAGTLSWLAAGLWGELGGRHRRLGVPREPMLFQMALNAFVIYCTMF